MAAIQHIIPLLLLSLLALATAHEHGHEEKEHTEVVVQGMVYCQSCASRGTWSLAEAKPLPRAKVGVSCRDYKRRVTFYKVYQTDANGYFYAPLQGLELKSYRMDTPVRACAVHLISSRDPACNLLTNTNAGINGSPLRYQKKLYNGTSSEAELYSAGPLAFRPRSCPLKRRD